jgi:hypothetical protein
MTLAAELALLIIFGAAFICGACRLASAADRRSKRIMRDLEIEAERYCALAEAGCPPSHPAIVSQELQRNHG